MRWAAALVCVVLCAACTPQRGRAPASTSSTPRASAARTDQSARPSAPQLAVANDPAVVPVVADDPSTLGRQLVAAEQTVRAPGTRQAWLLASARIAQVAYRRLALHPDWDPTVLASVPASLRATVVANLRARRELRAIKDPAPKDLVPAWRIEAPAPAGRLLAWYRAAGTRFGVGWQYLAAVNLIESTFGKIHGLSASGAQGPMQFLPETWSRYGAGGEVSDPQDAIFAAARYLADRGFARGDVDAALYAYNPTPHYGNAVKAIASVLVADPGSFAGYYRWDVYYPTSSGVLLLPPGFSEDHRTSAAAYALAHPDRVLR
jgi:membrane-bound lytic murein transglycosylase B